MPSAACRQFSQLVVAASFACVSLRATIQRNYINLACHANDSFAPILYRRVNEKLQRKGGVVVVAAAAATNDSCRPIGISCFPRRGNSRCPTRIDVPSPSAGMSTILSGIAARRGEFRWTIITAATDDNDAEHLAWRRTRSIGAGDPLPPPSPLLPSFRSSLKGITEIFGLIRVAARTATLSLSLSLRSRGAARARAYAHTGARRGGGGGGGGGGGAVLAEENPRRESAAFITRNGRTRRADDGPRLSLSPSPLGEWGEGQRGVRKGRGKKLGGESTTQRTTTTAHTLAVARRSPQCVSLIAANRRRSAENSPESNSPPPIPTVCTVSVARTHAHTRTYARRWLLPASRFDLHSPTMRPSR